MTNRKYRVVCMLNALERRLRALRDGGQLSAQEFERLFRAEADAIRRAVATQDLRYVRGRLEYMLEEAGLLEKEGIDSPLLAGFGKAGFAMTALRTRNPASAMIQEIRAA